MCGIFGYTGTGIKLGSLLSGLERLEYRGYDSCGIAAVNADKFFLKKRPGKINQLRADLNDLLGTKFKHAILHTRWATHGRPNYANAHPHADCGGAIAVVHNGIIENYLALKGNLLKEGHSFASETDTEVIVHLIEKFYKGDLRAAVGKAIQKLEGSFALGAISLGEPGTIVAARKGSPLIIGLADEGNFLASDIPALLPFTNKVIYLKDGEIAAVRQAQVEVSSVTRGPVELDIEKITIKPEDAEKKGHEHFMLKEIYEQPEVIEKTLSLYAHKTGIEFSGVMLEKKYLKNLRKIFITACGTAYHAGFVAKYFLEKYCGLDVEIDTSSEFRYRTLNIGHNDLLLTISQSGETADTLAAVREAKKRGAKVLSVCNVLGSSLVKESHSLIYTPAGPEIGVASTKAYTAQVFALYLFSLYLAGIKSTLQANARKEMLAELKKIPAFQRKILGHAAAIRDIAKKFSKMGCFLFLGRGINYPSAMEGALKLKEISYIPAEGYPAGEMKHGPIALIDEYRGVVCIAPRDSLYEKMISNIQEIKARKGMVLGVLNEGDKEASLLSDEIIHMPALKNQNLSPLLVAVVLQLFAYYVAKNLGCEIDQPRNLAKSVTVE